jgi:hypothetical protein
MSAKVEIIQAVSQNGNTYLIHKFQDGNAHHSFDIYKLVDNEKDVAREFGISEIRSNGITPLNTREMCEKMVEKIKAESLYYNIEK